MPMTIMTVFATSVIPSRRVKAPLFAVSMISPRLTQLLSRNKKSTSHHATLQARQATEPANARLRGFHAMYIPICRFATLFVVMFLVTAASAQEIRIVKDYAASTLDLGEITTLEITLVNQSNQDATNISFVDDFPASIPAINLSSVTNSCNGTLNLTATEVELTGGSIAAPSAGNVSRACVISFEVRGLIADTAVNTIEAGDVTAVIGGVNYTNADLASDTVDIIARPIEQFRTTYYVPGTTTIFRNGSAQPGETYEIVLEFDNQNLIDLTNVTMSLATGVRLDSPGIGSMAFVSSTCGNGVGSASADTRTLVIERIPPGQCEVRLHYSIPGNRYVSPFSARAGVTYLVGTIVTDQGATNTTNGGWGLTYAPSLNIIKSFTPSSINLINNETSTLRIVLESYSTVRADNWDVTDQMPPGIEMTGALPTFACSSDQGLINSIGSVQILNSTTLQINDISLQGDTPYNNPQGNAFRNTCVVEVEVTGTMPGAHENTIPFDTELSFTTFAGVQFGGGAGAARATLTVLNDGIELSWRYAGRGDSQPARLTVGDDFYYRFAIRNVTDFPITDLTITEPTHAQVSLNGEFRALDDVRIPPRFSNCGTPTYTVPPSGAGAESHDFTLSDVTIAPNSECVLFIPFYFSASGFLRNSPGNTIFPVGSITYQVDGSNAIRTYGVAGRPPSPPQFIGGPSARKFYSSATVAPGTTVRLRFEFVHTSYGTTARGLDTMGIQDWSFEDLLPEGQRLAANPNLTASCNLSDHNVSVTLDRDNQPGRDLITIVANMVSSSQFATISRCDVAVDVVAGPVDPNGANPNRTVVTNRLINTSRAIDPVGQQGPVTNLFRLGSPAANLTSIAGPITLSKTFSTATASNGDIFQVFIDISNQDLLSTPLTDVTFTDILPPGMTVAEPSNASVIATQTGSTCSLGNFTTTPARDAATFSGGTVGSFSDCQYRFDVTVDRGGNITNTLPGQTLQTSQGVTNPITVSTTVTVAAAILLEKEFGDSEILPGDQTDLTIRISNPFTFPLEFASSNALIDTMPEGMTIIPGSEATTCGGTVSLPPSNDRIELNGGVLSSFQSCEISARVTVQAPGSYDNVIAPRSIVLANSSETNQEEVRATLIALLQELTGLVFVDDGSGGLIAYNGLQDGPNEVGLSGVEITLRDCPPAATVYETARTGADGTYSLSLQGVPGTNVCVERQDFGTFIGVSAWPGTSGGTVSPPIYARVDNIPVPPPGDEDVNFGVIPLPTLELDQIATISAGQSVLLPHTYTATGPGTVSFDLINLDEVPATAFTDPRLIWDEDCDLALDAGETVVPPSFAVSSDGNVDPNQICLLIQLTSSSAAPAGSIIEYDLRAATDLPDVDTAAVIPNVFDSDTVTVDATESLILIKRVCNVSQQGDGSCDDGDFGVTSTGEPGDILEYQLTFRNPSATALQDVQISDATPAFTRLAASPFVNEPPTPVGACSPSAETAGFVGDMSWTCTTPMPSGAEWSVGFQVQVAGN